MLFSNQSQFHKVHAVSDVSQAILYSCDEAGLNLRAPLLVINDSLLEMKSRFSEAEFWNPETQQQPQAKKFKSILLFAPKQKTETRYLLAWALRQLENDGVLAIAASNDAGGKSLTRILKEFGLYVHDISKHKCRVVWTDKPQDANSKRISQAIEQGDLQRRQDGLWSQPGVFSWDELDKGTALLLPYLSDLSGKGADFGCGIGIIGLELMKNPAVRKLTCIDRDIRALQACELNLAEYQSRIEIRQADLMKQIDLSKLDFIAMNPPFHTGKKESISLGKSFIVNAASSLKSGGLLVMVANSHLPYEDSIEGLFSSHKILSEEKGFKIIEAVK